MDGSELDGKWICKICFTKCTAARTVITQSWLYDKQVHSALEEMMSGECPTEILKSEGNNVAYFNNFENAPEVGGGGLGIGVNWALNGTLTVRRCLWTHQFSNDRSGTAVKNAGFCGKWSLKNAEVLFMDSYTKDNGNYYGAVSLDKNSMVSNPSSSLAICQSYAARAETKGCHCCPFHFHPSCLSALLCLQGNAERWGRSEVQVRQHQGPNLDRNRKGQHSLHKGRQVSQNQSDLHFFFFFSFVWAFLLTISICLDWTADGDTNAWTCKVPCRRITLEAATSCWRFTCTKTTLARISMWTLSTLERWPPPWIPMVNGSGAIRSDWILFLTLLFILTQ